jgi:hypothetical protein
MGDKAEGRTKGNEEKARHNQHIRAKQCFAFYATDTSFMKYFEV